MRCLTFANAMTEAGYKIRFACTEGTIETVPMLERSGFNIITLADPLDSKDLLGRLEAWVDVAAFDHYGIDEEYERALRAHTKSILVIDDLANRPHDCDILVDQTFGRNAIDYVDLVPGNAAVLAGAQYAMLRPEFAAAREATLARRAAANRVHRILISMGLTDLEGITSQVLDAVLAAETGAAIDVVLGQCARSTPNVLAHAAQNPNIAVHIDSTDMCALMSNADIAIGAVGTTTWERCCLGLPTIAMALASNQKEACAKLAAQHAILLVNEFSEITSAIRRLSESSFLRKKICAAAQKITDGNGVDRILNKLKYSL